MMDFTIKTLTGLYKNLVKNNYEVTTLCSFLKRPGPGKICVLRHDVDRQINTALKLAELESKMNIKASYYFRYPATFREDVIRRIHKLGHETGYHYEVLAKTNGNYKKAFELFKKELTEFRKIVSICTISAHGSPFSKWDNKKIWETYKFTDLGITGEAYLSVNFNEVFYLTDTGRAWNRSEANIRDKVDTKFNLKFRNTKDVIAALDGGKMPDNIILNVHPNRWKDNFSGWCAELAMQNFKNIGKRFLHPGK
ncbi:MAG: hypothetical protein PHT53_01070 [Candidatus Omnitrophica bacterium]|nr:hypothetical protein [Candidatus Omnitrophota bacterium]